MDLSQIKGSSNLGNSTNSATKGGQIDIRLERMDGLIDNLREINGAMVRRLYAVTGLLEDALAPCPAVGTGDPVPPQVPMADRLNYMEDKLAQIMRDFEYLLNRIEA